MTLRIKQVPLGDLTEDSKNARLHPDRNMKAICGSLERFGQRLPLVVRKGIVVAGNGRLRAMRELGWKTAAVVDASDMTEEEARAFAVADNRTGELAEWDYELLSEMVRELQGDGAVLDELLPGWEAHELGPMLEAQWAPPDVVGDLEDDFQPVDRKTAIKLTPKQRRAFDLVASEMRAEHGDLGDGEVVEMLCNARSSTCV